jgi:5'-deoxynucleotidase YfbR-like HD superfamily hydrolase
MPSFETSGGGYERNHERAEDIKFIRAFLKQMAQTRVLRWREADESSFVTPEQVREMKESDAEHTGQIHSLATGLRLKAQYEDDSTLTENFDWEKARAMIGLHDIEENLTGDSRVKDEAHYIAEEKAREEIFKKLDTLNFGELLKQYQLEYLDKSTKEARFVKAIDEIQAWFYMIYTRGFAKSNRNFHEPETIRGYEYAQEFPTLKRIADILLNIMQRPGIISSEIEDIELIKMQYGG